MSDRNKPYLIVVGVDYSDTGELAFDTALELALRHPLVEVHVLNVMPINLRVLAPELEFAAGKVAPSIDEAAARITAYVEKKLTAFRAARSGDPALAGLRVIPHLRTDSPAFEVAQLAADLEADLVVVGTHGRRALARMIMGSVAESTVRMAPCPVLVVRPKATPAPVPTIEPPCPQCVLARSASGGKDLWCAQHHERHGQRHTYHQGDRASADTNLPLVGRS